MAKRSKSSRTSVKRKKTGPPQKRLAVREDSQGALQALLLKRDRETKAAFDAAHKDGMNALEQHDRPALTDAVDREGRAVAEHAKLVKQRLFKQKRP